MEVAEEIARALGRKPRFVQVAFASIDASVQRGDFDIGMSGVEDTPARRAALAASIPYFEFREVLTVRAADAPRLRTFSDFRDKRIGTLGGTIAYDLLLANSGRHGFETVSYDDDVHPYEDLANGRIDAVLLDHIIAQRAMKRLSGLVTQPGPLATGHYIIVLAKENTALRNRIDQILRMKMRDGTLERIYRKWEIWDEGQQRFFERVAAARPEAQSPEPVTIDRVAATRRYLPALFRAASVSTSAWRLLNRFRSFRRTLSWRATTSR